jgi:ABC-type transport system substrate-binding protein
MRFSSFLDGQEVDARTFEYDPRMALALLDEGSYANGFAATLVFPEDDEQLKGMAEAMAKDMDKVGIRITLEPVPAEKLDAFVGSFLEEGVEVLWLERR